MFPEIVRDEVFRLETRRLWLRWPTLADAFDHVAPKPNPVTDADICLGLPGSACVAAWRAANETGTALHLSVEEKRRRTAIGSIHLGLDESQDGMLDVRLAPARFRDGLASEAVQVLIQTAFLLRAASRIHALRSARDDDGRETLERCGFGLVRATGETSPVISDATDRFTIDRSRWAQQQRWDAPNVMRTLSRFASPTCWSMPA